MTMPSRCSSRTSPPPGSATMMVLLCCRMAQVARGASARLSEPDFLFLSFSAIYFVTVPSILAPAAPAMGMCSATYADAPFSPAPPRMHENLVAEQQLERSKMSAWQILGAFFSIVMLVTTTYPAWAGLIMAYYPRDVINTAVYAISTPFIGFFPSQFLAFNKADGGRLLVASFDR